MVTELERLVRQRARSRCEYGQLPQSVSPLPHAIDHIIARQHHGPTMAENLALACFFSKFVKTRLQGATLHEVTDTYYVSP